MDLTNPVLVLSLGALAAMAVAVGLALLLHWIGCPRSIVRLMLPVGVVIGLILVLLAAVMQANRALPLWLAILVVSGIPELVLILLVGGLVVAGARLRRAVSGLIPGTQRTPPRR